MLIAEPFPSRKSISRNLIIEPFNRQALNCSKNAEYCDGNEDPENDTKKESKSKFINCQRLTIWIVELTSQE